MCVAQKCMWGISQVKSSQVKLSCYLLVERYRRQLPLNYREREYEWVSEWVRGSVTLNKILACFYSFSHTQATVLLTDWLLTVRSSLSLTLTLLTLTLLLRKYCYSETINGNRWHKNYIDYGSHSKSIIHCKKKMPPL